MSWKASLLLVLLQQGKKQQAALLDDACRGTRLALRVVPQKRAGTGWAGLVCAPSADTASFLPAPLLPLAPLHCPPLLRHWVQPVHGMKYCYLGNTGLCVHEHDWRVQAGHSVPYIAHTWLIHAIDHQMQVICQDSGQKGSLKNAWPAALYERRKQHWEFVV